MKFVVTLILLNFCVHNIEVSKKEWVNPRVNNRGEGRTLCNHSNASLDLEVNSFFLGGLDISRYQFKITINIKI